MTDSIRELKSLGPKSQAMLAAAGITTVMQLREAGAVAAYVRVLKTQQGASLNLLWALESALTGVPWQQVSREQRTSLLLAVDACRDAQVMDKKR
ncbi:TfoX/Sxy family protein [Undibacterium sp. TS12]|uniref:TfoX/Sxy family protein n=1 Tax=Undibacterium sp. TS12 TaxID=2908202 RepID=UPI001F4CD901|nr:TfoX/Sxy family protein [Undibacterium sp. TS12]MCH8619151.1 TfoX/Sxy family protein [Undibacterium sp. TS12]